MNVSMRGRRLAPQQSSRCRGARWAEVRETPEELANATAPSGGRGPGACSGHQFRNHAPEHIRQAVVAALEAEHQRFVVDAEQREHRRVQVVNVHAAQTEKQRGWWSRP